MFVVRDTEQSAAVYPGEASIRFLSETIHSQKVKNIRKRIDKIEQMF